MSYLHNYSLSFHFKVGKWKNTTAGEKYQVAVLAGLYFLLTGQNRLVRVPRFLI
jgi:hypothetical protein